MIGIFFFLFLYFLFLWLLFFFFLGYDRSIVRNGKTLDGMNKMGGNLVTVCVFKKSWTKGWSNPSPLLTASLMACFKFANCQPSIFSLDESSIWSQLPIWASIYYDVPISKWSYLASQYDVALLLIGIFFIMLQVAKDCLCNKFLF